MRTMKLTAIPVFLSGLTLLFLTLGNHYGLIFPPQISTNFQVWFTCLFLGIILTITGICLWIIGSKPKKRIRGFPTW